MCSVLCYVRDRVSRVVQVVEVYARMREDSRLKWVSHVCCDVVSVLAFVWYRHNVY